MFKELIIAENNLRVKSFNLNLCLVITSLILAAVLKISVSIKTTNAGYELGSEMKRAVTLNHKRREYELKLSMLLKNEYLRKVAKDRLGFVDLPRSSVVRVKKINNKG